MRNSFRGHVLLAALIFIALALSTAGVLYLWPTRPSQPPTPPSTVTAPPETVTPAAPITTTSQPTTVSPAPAGTPADWKTYTNTNYGFQFNHPSTGVKLQEDKNQMRLFEKNRMGYFLEIKRIDTNKSVEAWWADESKNYTPYLISRVDFNNNPAYYFRQNTKEVQVPMDKYAIQRAGHLITISFEVPFNLELYEAGEEREGYRAANEEFNQTTKKIIDQILATFKFLD